MTTIVVYRKGIHMNIIKRSGKEVSFDASKIEDALKKANLSVIEAQRMSDEQIRDITKNVVTYCTQLKRSATVEEIQDCVEEEIMKQGAYKIANNYITYRYKRELIRKSNTTDKQILSLLECDNE